MTGMRKFIIIICLIFSAVLMLSASIITAGTVNTLPDGIVVSSANGVISYREYCAKTDSAPGVTAFSAAKSTASANGLTIRISEIITDEKFAALTGKDIISGSWFDVSSLDRENNYIVIDSDLSVRLFFSEGGDVPGKEITVGSRVYRICGVCRSDEGFIRDISSDGDPVIFLPLSSGENTRINHLFIAGDGDNIYHQNDAAQVLNKALGIKISGMHVSNIGDKARLIAVYPFVFLRIIIFIALVLTILLFAEKLSDMFFGKTDPGIKPYAISAGLLSVFGILLYILCTLPGVPESFLPNENIFEVSSYISRYISETQILKGDGNNLFDNIIVPAFSALTVLYSAVTVIIAGLFLTCYGSISKRMTKKTNLENRAFPSDLL